MTTEQVDTARCVACGRAYAGTSSRPRWAFDRATGRLVGTIHVGCAQSHGRHREFFAESSTEEPLDQAWFWAWARLVRMPWRRDPDEVDARAFVAGETVEETLSPAGRRLLDWSQRGPLQYPPERIAALEAAYRRLARDYRAWRESLEQAATRGRV